MFTAPDGGPLRHGNFMARHFKRAVHASGAPEEMRFHDLRHTCAALLINADPPAHPLAVMKRLGHSSITVTYNSYGHLFPALDEALTESVDRAYRSARAITTHSTRAVTASPDHKHLTASDQVDWTYAPGPAGLWQRHRVTSTTSCSRPSPSESRAARATHAVLARESRAAPIGLLEARQREPRSIA